MKGLLIKDFFCLKKQLINYAFIIAGVVAVSIMFVLSYNFGNIHAGFVQIMESGKNNEMVPIRIARSAMLLFMLMPLACAFDVVNLFSDDEKASFYKVAASFPVSIAKRVACRFIASYLFIAAGVAVDIIMTVILSSMTDIISIGMFSSAVISFASLILMYVSACILSAYLLGNEKMAYAGIIPLFIGIAVYVAAHLGKLRDFITGVNDGALLELYEQAMEFIFHKSYILLIMAVIISVASYFAAVYIAGRKRWVA